MRIPKVSHLQARCLAALCHSDGREVSGAALREKMNGSPVGRPVTFSKVMQALVAASLVRGRYTMETRGRYATRIRLFSITPDGRGALKAAKAFYAGL